MLVTEHGSGGLLVARDSMDEQAVGRALTRMTGGRFSLQKRRRHEHDPGDVVEVYKVVHVDTGQIVYTWMDAYGRPLPLSSGLLEGFEKHLNGYAGDADDHNRRLVEARERDLEAETQAVVDDHRPFVEKGRVSVAFGADWGKR